MFDKTLLNGGAREDHIVKDNVKFNIRRVNGNAIFFCNEVYPPVVFVYNGIPNEMDLIPIAEEILSRIKVN